VFVSVANQRQTLAVFPVETAGGLGFRVLATAGTAEMLRRNGIPCDEVAQALRTAGRRPARRIGRGRDSVWRDRHGDQQSLRQLRSAHRRVRNPLAQLSHEYSLRTTVQGAWQRCRHRGGIRVTSCDVAAGTAQRAGTVAVEDSVVDWPRRCPAGPAVPRHRPRIPTDPRLGACVDADGLAKFCDVCVAAFADFAVVKPQVAFFERSRAGFCVLERTIGACRPRGAGAGRRQTRRHRIGRWRPTPTRGR